MPLPRPTRPEYSTTIPSTGKKIRYQPFTVKEEKVLILAAESRESSEITNAVRNCLSNCITYPKDIDIDSLALFDIEYLFLRCRSKSVGETVKIKVTDPNDETCVLDHTINIDKVTVSKDKNHSNIIDIDEDIKVVMKYPNIDFFEDGIDFGSIDGIVGVFARCLSQIINGEEVYNRADISDAEVKEWIEDLAQGDFMKITRFFETMPKLQHSITKKNPKTGENFTVTLEGLQDFF